MYKDLAKRILRKLFVSPVHRRKRNKLFLANNKSVLLSLKEVLESQNIIFWLDFGTLLGAVRNNDFLAHDLDIDLGVAIKDHYRVLTALQENGFNLKRRIGTDDGTALEETFEKKGVDIDVFYYHAKNNFYVCHTFAPLHGKSWEETISVKGGLIIREHQFPKTSSNVETINFHGHQFNVPSNTSKHLAANYGENYLIEDKTFTYLSARNVVIIPNKVATVTYGIK